MAQTGYILALDQGTTGTTALLVDHEGMPVAQASRDIAQVYPRPGWVEHDPEEIYQSCMLTAREALRQAGARPAQVRAIGITNQRETTVVWERATGRPVANAIVWQCRRTAPLCEELKARGLGPAVRARTGLPIDAYFSATKVRWLLDSLPDGQRRAEAGELLFGTVDSWLLWKLTGGAVHATDHTNASRTMLFNIGTLSWDAELLRELGIPSVMLPQVRPSSAIFGYASPEAAGGLSAPIAGVAGDQQAALFGQACFAPGSAKNTYGTGCFILMNTGAERVSSKAGLVTTLACSLGEQATYALEGSVFSAGATVQWLRDGLGIIQEAAQVGELAASVPDTGGVYLVPAFTGLGAPHWDMYARGAIVGITRGTTRAHIARAALEATAFQTRDVIEAMRTDTGLAVPALRVDGGGTVNPLLMQFQADILGIPIQRAAIAETTAMGAAYLAGLAVGFWPGPQEVAGFWRSDATFQPAMGQQLRDALYAGWRRAVERAKDWAAR